MLLTGFYSSLTVSVSLVHGKPHHPWPFSVVGGSAAINLTIGASSGSLQAALVIGGNGGRLGSKFSIYIHTV